jgi:hypothetical protein
MLFHPGVSMSGDPCKVGVAEIAKDKGQPIAGANQLAIEPLDGLAERIMINPATAIATRGNG